MSLHAKLYLNVPYFRQSFWHLFVSPGLHTTLASSECPQLWEPTPRLEHEANDVSLPVQETSSSKIRPDPWPKWALPGADVGEPKPSCLQTTCASVVLHESSQIVPHSLLMLTSTRPSCRFLPPMRRTFQYPVDSNVRNTYFDSELTLTKIKLIKINHNWKQISFDPP